MVGNKRYRTIKGTEQSCLYKSYKNKHAIGDKTKLAIANFKPIFSRIKQILPGNLSREKITKTWTCARDI